MFLDLKFLLFNTLLVICAIGDLIMVPTDHFSYKMCMKNFNGVNLFAFTEHFYLWLFFGVIMVDVEKPY